MMLRIGMTLAMMMMMAILVKSFQIMMLECKAMKMMRPPLINMVFSASMINMVTVTITMKMGISTIIMKMMMRSTIMMINRTAMMTWRSKQRISVLSDLTIIFRVQVKKLCSSLTVSLMLSKDK